MHHPSYDIDLELVNIHAKHGPLNIIDYGCGNGVLLQILNKRRVNSYLGLEVSKAALDVAQKQYKTKNITFRQIEPNSRPSLGKANSVDLIILIGVFQYLTDEEISHVLSEAKRVLRPKGVLVASCVTDHLLYRITNCYQLFFPNRYINRNKLISQLEEKDLEVVHNKEKGLIIGPLFSHGLVILFDVLDKFIFRNRGKLGPIGIFMRELFKPLMMAEYKIPIDYGYTLFVVGKK